MTHINKRHPGGVYWQDGEVSVSVGNPDDGKYLVACDRHGQCTNVNNLAEAKRIRQDDFCEVCTGVSKWCNTCEADERPYGMCDEHDVIDDSLKVRQLCK